VMTPNEGFAELIRSGDRVDLAPTTSEYCAARRMTGAPAFHQKRRGVAATRLERQQSLGGLRDAGRIWYDRRWRHVPLPFSRRQAADDRPCAYRHRRDRHAERLLPPRRLARPYRRRCRPSSRAHLRRCKRLLPALRSRDVPVIWLNWGNRPDRLNLSPALLHVYKPIRHRHRSWRPPARFRRQSA